ncbi:MAG: UDP-N-acetylglucosamine 2-epimerase (non-hydrolyzing) [Anaerolineales bacterium]|nr:UDP-N-acetylglucosamine 2-epimerase (non-hydrolyzing) [Anaerolineales bacterium]
MKIVSIVGARPQFVKAAVVSQALRQQHQEILVHTGQHYDYQMSRVFFEELDLPEPDVNLEVGSGSHGWQTGQMLARIEEILQAENPDWVLIYGDTNSTLAGALAGAKLHQKVAHVEAGLRSFNRMMPEEINRVVADQLSELLFCPSQTAVDNLAAEGIQRGVHLVGDVMADALVWAVQRAQTQSNILDKLELAEKSYLLTTVHRAENTNDTARLRAILAAFDSLNEPIIFPIHPRTRKILEGLDYTPAAHVRLIEPIGYVDMIRLQQAARLILTDSGGIQKEAYWLGVPCVTLRDQTEWVETIETGWNILTGAEMASIIQAVESFTPPAARPTLYGNGQAAAFIQEILTLAG